MIDSLAIFLDNKIFDRFVKGARYKVKTPLVIYSDTTELRMKMIISLRNTNNFIKNYSTVINVT